MQKHVNLVDLVKSFPTNIYLQKLASIQKRTSPVKFAHLAEKSEKGLISNVSTEVIAHRGVERSDALGNTIRKWERLDDFAQPCRHLEQLALVVVGLRSA